ncbi:MAG: bifunctional 5,10-methylenetetrahydrofolate dehydrogenase/5,10-methenyltetrahydrofolate cyclohydrolase [Candidatus Uhrbacteria bacterium]|nr:bifunctional 5,10-methylenetetrahydrofolate dehydrogenase/5,10-methenyltetrahydrofolate cyclohydrolase [Candidatus Uhrbacteria bacterium]
MTEILNGNVLAKTIKEKAKKRVAKMKFPPGLAVLLVGDNPASHLYVRLKEEAAKEVGIYVEKHAYPEDATDAELIAKIEALNKRNDINGILVQLPLPTQDADAIISAIHYLKDVDGFHPENRRLLLANTPNLVPPVSLAIMRLLQATRRPLKNKTAVILGNSKIFAEPLIELLRDAGVTATFVMRETDGMAAIARAADIIVVAIGEKAFLTPDMVKQSAIVIDVGTNKIDGKTFGDAAPELEGHAGFVSPVPGGVGPLTVSYLLFNVIKAMEVQKRIRGEEV